MRGPRSLLIAIALVGALVACGSNEPADSTTLSGVVRRGPTCPVEVAGSPCPDAPADGVTLVFSFGGREFTRTTTDADGRYNVELPIGGYDVASTEQPFGAVEPRTITIDTTGAVVQDFTIDTGIR